jgi:outer membrane protein TolC
LRAAAVSIVETATSNIPAIVKILVRIFVSIERCVERKRTRRFASTVLIGAPVPIHDGGTRAALLEQARNNADSAGAMLTHRRNDAVRQVVVADNALRTSLSAYSAANALAAAAQTTFDSPLASYRNSA